MIFGQSVLIDAVAIALSPATNNDLAWHNYQSVILPVLAGAATITGIQAPTLNDFSAFTNDPSEVGKHVRGPLYLINASGQSISLTCESGSSTAANRLTIPGVSPAASLTVADGYTAIFLYDYSAQRWRFVKPS
jgi:hypothetical protein